MQLNSIATLYLNSVLQSIRYLARLASANIIHTQIREVGVPVTTFDSRPWQLPHSQQNQYHACGAIGMQAGVWQDAGVVSSG